MSGSRWIVPLTLVAVLAAACATDVDQGPRLDEEPGVIHIHGLGLDRDDVYVATHFGLHVFAQDRWSRRSRDLADHMGFVLVSSDLMYRSGHPDLDMGTRDPDLGTSLGVQVSTDGGRRWRTLSNVLDPAVDFHAMTATRQDPSTLYGWDAAGGRGTFRSTDGGESWEPLTADGLPRQVLALAVSSDDGVVYASTPSGLHRSVDQGATWDRISQEVLAFLATDAGGEVIFASRANEVLRSVDEGRTWEPTPLRAEEITAVSGSPDGSIVLAADTTNTVYRSDDGGTTWTPLPSP